MSDNYFQIFGLKDDYNVDQSTLEKAYLDLQIKYHPDRFINAPQEQKIYALNQSITVNDGFETLRDPIQRAQYMLKLRGVDVNDKTKSPACLLMEMMELGQTLEEAKTCEEITTATKNIAAEKEKALQHFAEAITAGNLTAALNHFQRTRFLTRLEENARVSVLEDKS